MQKQKIDTTTYIIADTHFGHKNINKHEPLRLTKSYENGFSDPDAFMIHKWNETITSDDTIFHLGDFAFKYGDIAALSQKLNGKKTLLIGNHDKEKDINILKENGWDIIDSVTIDIESKQLKKVDKIISQNKANRLFVCYVCDIESKRVMFTHFPLFDDNPYDKHYENITKPLEEIFQLLKCDINIHGHTHSKGAKEPFCISACVEKTEFLPVLLSNLLKKES